MHNIHTADFMHQSSAPNVLIQYISLLVWFCHTSTSVKLITSVFTAGNKSTLQKVYNEMFTN